VSERRPVSKRTTCRAWHWGQIFSGKYGETMGNSMKNMKMSRKITMIDGIHGSFRAFFWDFLGCV